MTYGRDSSGRRVEFAMARCGAALVLLCAIGLSAPLHGCTRTARAVGNLVESIGADMKAMVGPEKKAVATKGGDE